MKLFYPESIDELEELIIDFNKRNAGFDLIGYASNTLFMPSYSAENVVCTKKLSRWTVDGDTIVCDCGVNVAMLAREMVKEGITGFYGLVDLPGTIASAVYGNCGCYDCSVCDLLEWFTLLTPGGEVKTLHVGDLKLQKRSSSLKRHEMGGVILQVALKRILGDAAEETEKAEEVRRRRKDSQPNAANNLGTTFIFGDITWKGWLMKKLAARFYRNFGCKDYKEAQIKALRMLGGAKYEKYLFSLDRYMFPDARAHELFPEYIKFISSFFKDCHLEIEIRK